MLSFAKSAARRLLGDPDLIIKPDGETEYLRRWYVVPRRKYRFNVYIHQMLADDDHRALHDHPWENVSVFLAGEALEIVEDGSIFTRKPGNVVFRMAEQAHRFEVVETTWTLFLTGPVRREWGFHCPKGWVHWRQFTQGHKGSSIGRGCD